MRLMGLGILVSLLACACGGSSATPAPSATPATTPTINIVGQNGTQAFSPNPASFGGQMVVFHNTNSVTHRVVLNDGSVDTGDIPPGGSSQPVMMPVSGTNYHCAIHPGMIGAVESSSGGAAPTCEGAYCTPY
jgi:plastocyanin